MKINRKLLLLSATIILGACSALANESETMQVKLNSGDDRAFELSVLERVSFSGDSMIVQTTTGNTKIAIADIDRIKFALDVTAVDDIKADLGDDVQVTVSGGVVTVARADGGDLNVTVYNLQGQVVSTFAGKEQATLDTASLANGVYIIKANNKVIKLRK